MCVSVLILATTRSEHKLSRMVQNPLTTYKGVIIILYVTLLGPVSETAHGKQPYGPND
jgi:hypothetical protein